MALDQTLQTYLTSISPDEAIAWKHRLDQYRRDCGCRVGLIVMLSVTVPWIVYSFLSMQGQSWQRSIGTGLLVLFVSGLVGKVLGVGLARIRFTLAVRSLRKRVCGRTVA
jgi:hypothetical protein